MRFRTPTRTGESPAELGRGCGLEGRTWEKVPTTLRNRQRRAPCQPVTHHTSQCPRQCDYQTAERLLESCCYPANPGPSQESESQQWYLNLSNADGQLETDLDRKLDAADRADHGPFPFPSREGAVYGSQQCSGKWYPKPQLLIGFKQTSPFFSSEYNFPMPNYIPDAFTLRYATGNTVLLFGIKMEHLTKDFLDLSQT